MKNTMYIEIPLENSKGQPLNICKQCKGKGSSYYTKNHDGTYIEVLKTATCKINKTEICKCCKGTGYVILGGF